MNNSSNNLAKCLMLTLFNFPNLWLESSKASRPKLANHKGKRKLKANARPLIKRYRPIVPPDTP